MLANNSKYYYVITQEPGLGESVCRQPINGNETVLDAIARIAGLSKAAGKKTIWIVRPVNQGGPQTLPIDWDAITRRGRTEEDLQILPGDRVFVAITPAIARAQIEEAEARAAVTVTAQGGKVVVATPGGQLIADRIELGQSTSKPAATRLDFRVAAARGDGKSGLRAAEVAEYMKEEPAKSRKSGRPYAWFELHTKGPTNLIDREYEGRTYALLSTTPEATMLDVGSWGLKQAAAQKDATGRPTIGLELNVGGGRKMAAISKANLRRPLAVLFDDVVASAPVLQSSIANSAKITGNFSEDEVKQLVSQLQASITMAGTAFSETKEPPKKFAVDLGGGVKLELVLIPAGEFLMGSLDSDRDGIPNEHPQHRVRISKPFYLGTYHVTRGQFRQFVTDSGYKTDVEKGEDPGAYGWNADANNVEFSKKYTWRNSGFEQTDEHPVVNVSWNDAVAFCKWLSGKEGKTYRLPTEAEWEYACRASGGLKSQSQLAEGFSSKKTSAGVLKPRHARGRLLSSFSTCRTS